MTQIEQDIQDIKKTLDLICQQLGIGAVSPAKVMDIKAIARKRAAEIQLKHGYKKNSRP